MLHCPTLREFSSDCNNRRIIELCTESVKFGKENNIPVVLDLRDMWPELFLDLVPKVFQPYLKMLLRNSFIEAQNACANATSLMGHTDGFVEWGLKNAGRERSKFDIAFPFGYSQAALIDSETNAAKEFWQKLGLVEGKGHKYVCFIGSISRQLDIGTILKTAKILLYRNIPIKFIMCGLGDRFEILSKVAQSLNNVIMPGWVNKAAVYVLMQRSFAGLNPLPDRYDFHITINNKAIEYLSGGLPIIACPRKTTLTDLIIQENCGFCYDYGDAEGLADIIIELSQNEELQKTMSENARGLFLERFTAEKVYTDMMNHLQTIITAYKSGEIRK